MVASNAGGDSTHSPDVEKFSSIAGTLNGDECNHYTPDQAKAFGDSLAEQPDPKGRARLTGIAAPSQIYAGVFSISPALAARNRMPGIWTFGDSDPGGQMKCEQQPVLSRRLSSTPFGLRMEGLHAPNERYGRTGSNHRNACRTRGGWICRTRPAIRGDL